MDPSSKLLASRGILALLFGTLLLVWSAPGLLTLAIFFGAYAFFDGVLAIVSAFRRGTRTSWDLPIIEGGVGITTGVVTVFWPAITLFVLSIFVGAWALTTGCLEVLGAIRLQDFFPSVSRGPRILLLLAGLVSITLGSLIFSTQKLGQGTFLIYVAAYSIVFGVLMTILGVQLSRKSRQKIEQLPEPRPGPKDEEHLKAA